jgi:hypothetical protein
MVARENSLFWNGTVSLGSQVPERAPKHCSDEPGGRSVWHEDLRSADAVIDDPTPDLSHLPLLHEWLQPIAQKSAERIHHVTEPNTDTPGLWSEQQGRSIRCSAIHDA